MRRLVLGAMLLNAGCGGGAAEGTGRIGAEAGTLEPADSIRFVFDASAAEHPVVVAPYDGTGQPGWIVALRGDERMFFVERCEIEDCGVPPAVCGAVPPMVVDLRAVPSRSIETVWDLTTSTLDPETGCERREAVDGSGFVARFCYAIEAEAEGPVGAEPVFGTLVDRRCAEVPFQLSDSIVVFAL